MKKLLTVIIPYLLTHFAAIAQMDTSSVVYSWRLDKNYDGMERIQVDTSLVGFQVQNPAYQQFTSSTTLGNFSLPTISNLFTERDRDKEFILVNTFYPFMKHFWNSAYINTRKPFTNLSYSNGGSGENKEEILDVFHSQNISQILNAGFHLTTSRAFGQYSFQKVKNNSFKLFSSYSGNNYTYHFNVNINKIIADENGGIYDDRSITDTVYSYTKEIPTLFGGFDNLSKHEPDVFHEIRNINAFTIHELALRTNTSESDSSTRKRFNLLNPKLGYIFYLDRTVNLFHDAKPSVGYEEGLYKNLLINENTTADSLYYWKLYNGLRLKFQGKDQNRYFIDFAYEMMYYTMATSSGNPVGDTLLEHWFISQKIKFPSISYNNKIYNTHISSGFSKMFGNRLEMDLYGRYYLSGYRKGDFLITGDLKLSINPSGASDILRVRVDHELKTPDFIYSHYASNNFIWTRNFKQTVLSNWSIILDISSKKIELKGDYYLFRDFIFFNQEAFPEQYHNTLSVLVLSLAKRFEFWKITMDNKLAYQTVNNDAVLSLPALIWNNSTYLTHMFNFKSTGGKLLTIIGFDLKYNTKYYANAYMPPLATFYQQREKKLGNYPYVDMFLNVQLKRFRFFLKFEHINTNWIDRNYFTALHYPMNERNLKLGISWTFYD